MRRDVDRRTRRNLTQLVDSATNERLVVTAYMVLERVYNTDGQQVGYRELTGDIENAARVFDPDVVVNPAPPEPSVRAWIAQFITDGIADNQLIFEEHESWVDAKAIWDDDS